jgi:hypothetical protein
VGEEGFIVQKACDAKPSLTARTPFPPTAGRRKEGAKREESSRPVEITGKRKILGSVCFWWLNVRAEALTP